MDDQRPIRLAGEIIGIHQPVDERSEAIVHRALTPPQIELDAEILEVLLLFGDRDIVIVPPQRQIPRPTVLQVERGLTCTLSFIGVVLAPLDNNRIHLGQIVERDRRLVGVRAGEGRVEVGKVGLAAFQFDDQLADRHTPVTHVNVADNLVACNAEEPLEALTNDRGAEMPYMHRLRHVRTAVVDDHLAPGVRYGDSAALVVLHHLRVASEVLVGDDDVDEAGTGDVERCER